MTIHSKSDMIAHLRVVASMVECWPPAVQQMFVSEIKRPHTPWGDAHPGEMVGVCCRKIQREIDDPVRGDELMSRKEPA